MRAPLWKPASLALFAVLSLGGCVTGKSVDGEVAGIVTKPEGEGPFPAVVLLSHCGGAYSDSMARDWPAYLKGLGYASFTVDTYGPRGASTCEGFGGFERWAWMRDDAYHALDHLAGLPDIDGSRVAVMGFSDGAIAINSNIVGNPTKSAEGNKFKAAIAMYGHCKALLHLGKNDIPLTIIVGENDRKVVLSCKVAAHKHPGVNLYVFEDTYHAFDQRQHTSLLHDSHGNPMLYSSSATEKARRLTRDFLAQHLGK